MGRCGEVGRGDGGEGVCGKQGEGRLLSRKGRLEA